MFTRSRSLLLLACAAGVLLLSACASLPESAARDPRDPLERYNRAVFGLNQVLDRNVARPIALGYTRITPRPIRLGVSNFLSNLGYPVVMVNDLLQGQVAHFGRDTARFVVNTTVGLGGLFDPAAKWGLESRDEDLGQTFGAWGLPAGAYLMLPILGPVTVRDGVGDIGDFFLEPLTYVGDSDVRWGLTALDLLDTRAGLLDNDDVLEEAFDPYAFVRSAYLQRREYLVRDGDVPEDTLDESVSPDPAAP